MTDLQQFFQTLLSISAPFHVAQIEQVTQDDEPDRINIKLTVDKEYRPSEYHNIHSYKSKTWRHLNLFQYHCYIECRLPMFIDKRDQCCTLMEVPWARKNSGFTLLFEMNVLNLLRQCACKSIVARRFDLYPQRVETIYDNYTKAAYYQREPLVAERIGLDETSTRKGHDYISVFLDMDADRLVDLRPGKSSGVISDYVAECSLLGQHPETIIKEIVCDMSPAFKKGMRENLPDTKVTFDRFHVVQLVHRYLDSLKRSKATDKQLLYGYIEDLDRLWDQPDEIAAAGFLQYWMDRGEELFGLKSLSNSLNRHFDGIVAYCRTKLTNGKLEGVNNKIQWIKRAARGYRSKENFMRMVWFMFSPPRIGHQLIS
jgi:transposase